MVSIHKSRYCLPPSKPAGTILILVRTFSVSNIKAVYRRTWRRLSESKPLGGDTFGEQLHGRRCYFERRPVILDALTALTGVSGANVSDHPDFGWDVFELFAKIPPLWLCAPPKAKRFSLSRIS